MVCLLPRASRAAKRNKYKETEDMKKSDAKENLSLLVVLKKYSLDIMCFLFFLSWQAKEMVSSRKSVKNNLAVVILDQGSTNYGSIIKFSQPPDFCK